MVVATTGLLVASVLPQYLVASTAVRMRDDFPFSDAELGAAIAVTFALSAPISLASGRVISRLGLRRSIVLAAGLVIATSAAMTTIAAGAAAVIALMALNGLGSGLGTPCFSAVLARSVPVERQGTAFGMLTSAPQLAGVVGGLALPLIAEPFGWRAAFAVPGLVSVACLAALLAGGRIGAVRAFAPPRRRRRGRVRTIHAIALAAGLAGAAGMGMRSFLVVFAVSAGFDRAAAGLLFSVTGLIALSSRLGLGVLGDRRPGDPLRRAATLMVVSAAGFVLMAVESGPLVIIAGALLAGGVGWGWNAPLSHAVVSRNPEATEAAVGIQMAGFFLGSLVGPLAVGVLVGHGSYAAAWATCSLLVLAAAGVVTLTRRMSPVIEMASVR